MAAVCKKETESSLFWDVTLRRMVVIYRGFGTTYVSHIQGWSFTLKMEQTGFPETSVNTNLRHVTSQKSEGLIYTSAEAWNHKKIESFIF